MFGSLGRYIVRHPWQVILAWILLAVVVVATAPKLESTSDEADFLPSHYESIKALEAQQEAFPELADTEPAAIVVVDRADGAPLSEQDVAAVEEMAQDLSTADIDLLDDVRANPPSENGLVQTISVGLAEGTDPFDVALNDSAEELREQVADAAEGTDLRVGVTGSIAQNLDATEAASGAEAAVGVATIGLIVVLLLVIFRSPIIALLPIVVITIVSQVATGLIAYANELFGLQTDSSITVILIVVLFGIGTDYILFVMFRYRERLREGEGPKEAMIHAIERAGEAIASAGGAVIVAFLALVLSTLSIFRAIGPALAIAVAVTVVAALTLVPAVVSLLGTKVFWPSKAWKKEPRSARFGAMGGALGRHPGRFALASGLLLASLAVFAFGFKPSFDFSQMSLPDDAESMVASERMLEGYPAGATAPQTVVLQSTDDAPLEQADLASYGEALNAAEGVAQVAEPIPNSDGTAAIFVVTLDDDPMSDVAMEHVEGPIRTAAHDAAPDGSEALVGGTTSIFVDLQDAMVRDYSVVFPVAALMIMVILALLLRSLVAPLYLMASVGLGFAATLGATVLVFQVAQGQDGLIFMLPIYIYLFVTALGTDYNILMIARLREEARHGKDPHAAAAWAVRHAGPTIAAAGLILAGSFAALMLGGNPLLVSMGFAISFGILVAAFVMSMFFTPSLTALLGHAAWWPGRADRARPQDEVEEPLEVSPRA
ncbi:MULTISPECIES: MMPL family transporter [Mumia]|uniref:MMPL family transporter n=1 Tax=Mumia TaxID=1546255 RepID=UPI00141E73BE|nr:MULTISPECIES: MMPL family transporter [unclassified Mumia]QMW64767.1 MMPL family transporter [Mumia sp. ZJ1417]